MNKKITNAPSQEFNDKKINKIVNKLIKEDTSLQLAEFFKVFGDSTRIRIINVLSKSEACVGDISAALDMSQSAISHQLKILRDAKLVKYRKEGKVAVYFLADHHVKDIYEEGFEHISE